MRQRTLVIIKPDAVAAGNVGRILARYEEAGLGIVAMDLRTITGEFADRHYVEHLERGFYPVLREFMTSGPLIPIVFSGAGSIEQVREINGATNPADAAPGTIRADFGGDNTRNAVHASDSTSSAEAEIALWFPGL